MTFIKDNLSTIIVSAVILSVVGIIVYNMYKNKKAGKSSCSCGCGGCAMSDSCHKK